MALGLSESGAVVDFLPRVARRPVEPLSPPDHRGSATSLTLGAVSRGYGGTVTWLGILKDRRRTAVPRVFYGADGRFQVCPGCFRPSFHNRSIPEPARRTVLILGQHMVVHKVLVLRVVFVIPLNAHRVPKAVATCVCGRKGLGLFQAWGGLDGCAGACTGPAHHRQG